MGGRRWAVLAWSGLLWWVWVSSGAAQPAAEESPWRLDSGLGFERFEQQAKVEVGGARGERLVEYKAAGLWLAATYRPLGWLGFGLYSQVDVGARRAGRLDGFDAEGAAITGGQLGGRFREFWLGPLLRLRWHALFAEAGWGALGLRWDRGRRDLPARDGGFGVLRTSRRVAWLFALGGLVPIWGDLQLVLRVQYRIRYYVERGGVALANDLVHGTQNLSPFVGVGWRR